MAAVRLAAAFGAYDHAVFVTYSLCFMSLLFVAIAALGQVPACRAALLFFADRADPAGAHLQAAARRLRPVAVLARSGGLMVLLVFIVIILLLFLNLLLVLGALG